MFKKMSYHILSHENTDDVLLGVNVFEEKEIDKNQISFKRLNNDLYFSFDKEKIKGVIFCDLPPEFWKKVYSGHAILVEFGPINPVEDYEIVL